MSVVLGGSDWGVCGRKGLTGSHVPCDMLRTSKGCVADGALMITGHLEERRRRRRRRGWSSVSFELQFRNLSSSLTLDDVVSGAASCLALLI